MEYNPTKAMEYFKRAADMGNHEAQYFCGFFYFESMFGLEDPYPHKISMDYFEKSSKQGNAKSQFQLANLKKNLNHPHNQIFDLLLQSSLSGYSVAIAMMKNEYEEGNFFWDHRAHSKFFFYFHIIQLKNKNRIFSF